MKCMRSKIGLSLAIIVVIVIILFLCVEIRPVSVKSSSVFTTTEQTEIQLLVMVNTLLDVDEEKIVREIIADHQEINGIEEKSIYILKLYRSSFHYRRNWEYDTIICDENGAIICCKEDLGV